MESSREVPGLRSQHTWALRPGPCDLGGVITHQAIVSSSQTRACIEIVLVGWGVHDMRWWVSGP